MELPQRIVALIDMDCFYCQVESRLNPELRGRPCAVVQYNSYKGGGIIAVNYEARAFGVTRGMRGDDAKVKCPDIELASVPEVRGKADLTRYRTAGKQVIDVLSQFGAVVERASVDEAYLDLTDLVGRRQVSRQQLASLCGSTFVAGHSEGLQDWLDQLDPHSCDWSLAVGAVIVEEMRAAVLAKTQFHCSAGIAHNKTLAKLACGLNKPKKQTVLPQHQVAQLFRSIHVSKVRGLGGKLGDLVKEQLNCGTMADVASLSLEQLGQQLDDKSAKWLYQLARGVCLEPVRERELPKSLGCSKNFRGPEMLDTKEKVLDWLAKLCEELSERLTTDKEENGRMARSLHVSVSMEGTGGSVSRMGLIRSYDASRLNADALAMIARVNEAKSSVEWRPKLTNISLSASKFEDCSASTATISSLFAKAAQSQPSLSASAAATAAELVPSLEHFEPSILNDLSGTLRTCVESRVQQLEAEKDLAPCERCGRKLSPFDMPEHLDFHFAEELQREYVAVEGAQQTAQCQAAPASNATGRRARGRPPKRKDDPERGDPSKKQKSITHFLLNRP